MLFADDIILVNETREGISFKLEILKEILKFKGCRNSRMKT